MGKWSDYGDDARRDFWRDMVVVYYHPDFRDMKPIDALQELKQRRGEYA